METEGNLDLQMFENDGRARTKGPIYAIAISSPCWCFAEKISGECGVSLPAIWIGRGCSAEAGDPRTVSAGIRRIDVIHHQLVQRHSIIRIERTYWTSKRSC